MSKRIFNSKIASDPSSGWDDLGDWGDLGDEYLESKGLDPSGFSVFRTENFDTEEDVGSGKTPPVKNTRTFRPTKFDRPPYGAGEGEEEQIVDPKLVAELFAPMNSERRITSLELQKPENKGWKKWFSKAPLVQSNIIGRRAIGAHYALIDEMARHSVDQCPNCKGKLGIRNCDKCGGHGHVNYSPENNIYNIKKFAKAWNERVDFHDTHCYAKACHPDCMFKEYIDKNVREPYKKANNGLKGLSIEQTHSRSGSPDNIEKKLRKRVVTDNYKQTAEILQRLGGFGDEPIQKFDTVHIINHDLNNPDGFESFAHTDPGHKHLWQEKIYSEGGRDHQMTGIVSSVNKEGTHGTIIARYRPLKTLREEKKERENVKRPGSNGEPIRQSPSSISFNAFDAINGISNDPEEVKREKADGRKKLKYSIGSIYNNITQLIGERSPVSSNRGYTIVLHNHPLNNVQRMSPMVAPLVATSGVVAHTMPDKDVPGRLEFDRNGRPKSKTTSGKKVKVDHIFRIGTGLSQDELKETYNNVIDPEDREHVQQFFKKAHEAAGINADDYDHPLSIIPRKRGADKGVMPARPQIVRKKKKFNSDPLGLDDNTMEVSSDSVPDAIDLTNTPEGKDKALQQLAEITGRHPDSFSHEEKDKIFKTIGEHNNIVSGGLTALGQEHLIEEDKKDD